MNYKKLFLRKKIRIYEKERNGQIPNPITIKHAINYTAIAWENVTSQTIANCWKKTGILPDVDNNSSTLNLLNEEDDLQSLIDQFGFSDPLSASEIISMIISNEQDQDEEGIEEGIGEEAPPVLNMEALLSIEKLKLYIEQQSDNLQVSNDELKSLKSLKRKIKLIEFNSSQQTNLHSFFNK